MNMKFFSPNIARKYHFRLNYQQFLTNSLECRLNSITSFWQPCIFRLFTNSAEIVPRFLRVMSQSLASEKRFKRYNACGNL